MGRVSPRSRRPPWLRALVLLLAASPLAGCVDQMADLQTGGGGTIASRATAATVALVSLEGAPAGADGQFRQALASEAAAREITFVDPGTARYLVRGYLSAYPSDQGIEVAYAYDVFEAADRHRRQRVQDSIDVPGDGNDPWSAVNASVMASLASRSADALAAGLADGTAQRLDTGPVASVPLTPSPAVN